MRLVSTIVLICASLTPCSAAFADGPVGGPELALLQSPEFKRRFVESYLSETDIEPKLSQIEREQMPAIMELISADKTSEAIGMIFQIRNSQTSAALDFTLANLFYQREQVDAAMENYKLAIEKHPKFRRAWKNMAMIHLREPNYPKALECLTKVIEFGGGDSMMFGLLGYCYSSLENHMSAESAFRMANMLDPKTLDWRMGMARCFFKQKRFADAAALCGTLMEEYPARTDLWLLQANAFIGMEQPMRAAENYEIADRMGASTADSLNMLGDIYINAELYEAAASAYLRALDKKSGPSRSMRAARIMTARGALQESKRLLDRVQTLIPSDASGQERKDLLKLRARLAIAEGSGKGEEVAILREIVELDPLDGEALMLLGQNSQRSGDPDKAAFYFEQAASIEAFEADAKVRHAQLLVSQGRYAEALPMLRRAQQLKPRENIQAYLEQIERIAAAR